MDDRNDLDWDPVPPVNPAFRGVVVAVLIMGIVFCAIGFVATAIALSTWALT